MNFNVKRKVTYGTIALFFMCGGVEYGVVFPTIWAYLQHLGARDETLLGLAVASFSMSGIIIGPIVGKWFDKTNNAKAALLFTNLFEIGGSFMYFSAGSPWFIILSRFVCGIGSGAGAVIFADIALGTAIETRTAIMSRLAACRQVGLMIGPAFNIILQQFNFDLFKIPVNPMTSPGLFMAALGIMLQCLFMFAYFNLGYLQEQEKLAKSLQHSYLDGDISEVERISNGGGSFPRHPSREQVSINHTQQAREDESIVSTMDETFSPIENAATNRQIMSDIRRMSDTNGMIESADDFIANSSSDANSFTTVNNNMPSVVILGDHSTSYETMPPCSGVETPNNQSHFQVLVEEFIRHEVIAVLGLTFIGLFAQTSLETIVTPLTQYLFNFGAYENSVLFLICGLEILIAFVAIASVSKYIEDRLMILIGMIILVFALSWLAYFLPKCTPGDKSNVFYFAVGVFFDLIAISMLLACSSSLFSKLISKERQGLGQGVRRSFNFAGTILGPLWAGAVTKRLLLLFAVPLILGIVMLMLFVLSYSSLHFQIVDDKPISKSSEAQEIIDEREPLISTRR